VAPPDEPARSPLLANALLLGAFVVLVAVGVVTVLVPALSEEPEPDAPGAPAADSRPQEAPAGGG
jgi:hypothetical protein